ncbi:MAG: hypothetical protein ALECFALPRED_008980 [Alectoria fallacina]|uniref:Glycosyltransferase family 25 protein n=1 Tax=Alectoria fallacina TaxID=1903189 RepID=A0A8H3J5R8_9LECA|nr:MAG: hypothetical protein ALECFALPRED_008980 [Alectoria fallacina]
MIRREMRETKRRMVLLSLLACFLFLTLVAFRRPNSFMSEYTHRSANPTASATSRTNTKAKSWLKGRPKSMGPVLGNGQRHLSDSSLADLKNTSLGFEKIFVLNMPSRTDKLDAMTLAASVTGFDFDVLEGVQGESIPKKALSGKWESRPGIEGVVGCWRGHMNFAKEIVRGRLSSALIIEDDADWDLNLRSMMEYIALGSQTLLDTPHGKTPRSPYGDGWDLMWFGHCASSTIKGDDRRFIMKNDPNVPPPQHRANYGQIPDMSSYDNNTRIMFFTAGNTCTYSYALSYHGAAKILKYLSMDIYNKPIDFGLREMCDKEDRGFKCLSVFPQIFGEHKPAGADERDSDIDPGNRASVRTKGYSHNTVHSTRLNVEHLIDGRMDLLENQYGEDPQLEGPIVTEYRTSLEEPVPSS